MIYSAIILICGGLQDLLIWAIILPYLVVLLDDQACPFRACRAWATARWTPFTVSTTTSTACALRFKMVEPTPRTSGTSTTAFPTDGALDIVIPTPLPQPFRRISLPSAPNLHRQSIISTISFNPLAEENHIPGATMPAVIKSTLREPKNRPSSVELGRRAGRRREVRALDEKKEAKRKQIINEFRDTERTYVDGLELIYSVRYFP